MASIRLSFDVAAASDAVWAAYRDVGQVHTRLARGFVTDCRMDGDARIATFANGAVARELIVDIDDKDRRLAYAIKGETMTHHNAAFQVLANGAHSRVVWTVDLLPDSVAGNMRAMMEQGCSAMKKTLEGRMD